MGLFDSSYDVLQDTRHQQQEEKAAAQTVATTGPITIDCNPSAPSETQVMKDNPNGKCFYRTLSRLNSNIIILIYS